MPQEAPRRWSIKTTPDVRSWLRALSQASPDVFRSVNVTIDMLAETGPALGRPMVDTLQGSAIGNLKELRPRSGRDVAIRVLFVFDPWSQAILLVAETRLATGSVGIRRRFRSPRRL